MIGAGFSDGWFTRMGAGIRTLEAHLSRPAPLAAVFAGVHLKSVDNIGLCSLPPWPFTSP